jgi:hypothetical protein
MSRLASRTPRARVETDLSSAVDLSGGASSGGGAGIATAPASPPSHRPTRLSPSRSRPTTPLHRLLRTEPPTCSSHARHMFALALAVWRCLTPVLATAILVSLYVCAHEVRAAQTLCARTNSCQTDTVSPKLPTHEPVPSLALVRGHEYKCSKGRGVC